MLRLFTLFLIAALSLLLQACANKGGYVQMYPGKPLAPTEVGYLKGVYEYRKGSEANETIRIVAIDGAKVPRQFGVAEGANVVSVLPGQYNVKIFYVHAMGVMDFYTYTTLRVQVLPNCVYQFFSQPSVNGREIHFGVLSSPASQNSNQACGPGVVKDAQIRA